MTTKRQVTDAVEQLSWSGVIDVDRTRQPYRVRLTMRHELQRLSGPLPEQAPAWGPLLRVAFASVESLEEAAALPEDLAGAQLHRMLRTHEDQLARLDLRPPSPRPPDTFVARTRHWLHELLHRLASGQLRDGH